MPTPRYEKMKIIALKRKPEMETFLGGDFLIAEALKPVWDDEGYPHWDIADPDTILMVRMGITPNNELVFQYEGKLYIREYRHVVEGLATGADQPTFILPIRSLEFPRWYYERQALMPYDGEYKLLPEFP